MVADVFTHIYTHTYTNHTRVCKGTRQSTLPSLSYCGFILTRIDHGSGTKD